MIYGCGGFAEHKRWKDKMETHFNSGKGERVNNVMAHVIMARLWRKLGQNKACKYKQISMVLDERVGEVLLLISFKTMAGRDSYC